MFPEAQHCPSCEFQARVRLAIARDIPLKFGKPVVAIAFRVGGMNRAAVPKAAIYVDGDTGASEHDIGARPTANRREVHPVSETSSMNQASDGQLRLGVATSISAHRTS